MRTLNSFVLAGALIVFAWLALPAGAQQQGGVLQTKDGRSYFYDSIQINGTTYLVRPHGLAPIEIPIGEVKCINAACGATPPPPCCDQRQAGHYSVQGSNTIGAALMPALIRKWGESMTAGKVDSKFGAPEEQTITITSTGNTPITIDLAAHGSATAFQGLLSGAAQIGMSSRAIKPDEAQALGQRYNANMLSPDSEHVIALDGLAIIVNKDNPLATLAFTPQTIAQVFSGEISDWQSIGGKPGAITVHARDAKSGTWSTFEDLILKPTGKTLAPGAKRYESSDDLTDAIAKDPSAIGFIGLPYVRDNVALAIGSTCGISVAPSRFTVQTEVYPLSRRLYLYTVGAPQDQTGQSLISFATSDAAQPVIREEGFIDQTIEFEDPQLKAKWIEDFKAHTDQRASQRDFDTMVHNAQIIRRGSVNFRFLSGSAELDNKALLDVQRLARYLQRPDMTGKIWYLSGFADADGDYSTNKALSEARANAVASALKRLGVQIPEHTTYGFSWLAPVACNDSGPNKSLNRRVEFWVQN